MDGAEDGMAQVILRYPCKKLVQHRLYARDAGWWRVTEILLSSISSHFWGTRIVLSSLFPLALLT